jgi:hypothetical protein
MDEKEHPSGGDDGLLLFAQRASQAHAPAPSLTMLAIDDTLRGVLWCVLRISHELETVAPRILGVEVARVRNIVVPDDSRSGCSDAVGERIQGVAGNAQRRMCLAGRHERWLDADVQLLLTKSEPDAAARLERRRLLDLDETQNVAEVAPGRRLAARRRRQLDMIDPADAHAAQRSSSLTQIPGAGVHLRMPSREATRCYAGTTALLVLSARAAEGDRTPRTPSARIATPAR